MNTITREELIDIITKAQGPCVSFFLPTHRKGLETKQDPLRFKNLLKQADRQLAAAGVKSSKSRQVLDPAYVLLEDHVFWQNLLDGLSVLASPNTFRTFRLPLSFRGLVTHGERFYIRPFLPLLSGDGEFYILAISQNTVRLLEASRDDYTEIDLGNIPKSLKDALGDNLKGHSLQFHTGTPGGGGRKRSAVFHGHGAGEDDRKYDIARFLQLVDDCLVTTLKTHYAPMILACVDYLAPLYREVSRYPNLLPKAVEGNPDRLEARELHLKAWELVRPLFLEPQEKDDKRIRELAGTDKATTDLKTIITAAFEGRIEALFLAGNEPCWGYLDMGSRRVDIHTKHEPGDVDLFDVAAFRTLVNGGSAYGLSEDESPLGEPIAAMMRY
jgi:hypothetical protein